jgi:diacylglycerol kinase
MIIHLSAAAAVSAAAALARIEPWGWAAVFLCFGLVIASELVNTAIERLCDLYTAEQSKAVRDVKDIAAGAVLVSAAAAVAVAAAVFILGRGKA